MIARISIVFALALTAAACGPAGPPEDPGERAARACAEQFGKGTPADDDCQVRLALQAAERNRSEKMRQAARSAGQ